MTDELEVYGPGSYITEFISGGPKSYAYEVFTPETGAKNYVCKAKGITLNFKTSQIVNFESLRKLVLSEEHKVVNVDYTSILRTKDKDVVTVPCSKLFQITMQKRQGTDKNYGTKQPSEKKIKLDKN